jgi:hypothetical protein
MYFLDKYMLQTLPQEKKKILKEHEGEALFAFIVVS